MSGFSKHSDANINKQKRTEYQVWTAESLKITIFSDENLFNVIEDSNQWQHEQMSTKSDDNNVTSNAKFNDLRNWHRDSQSKNILLSFIHRSLKNEPSKTLADHKGSRNVAVKALAHNTTKDIAYRGCMACSYEQTNDFTYFCTTASILNLSP